MTTIDTSSVSHEAPDAVHADRAGTLRAVGRLFTSELRLLLREPGVLVGLVAFPTVCVLVLAGVFGQGPDPDFGGVAPDDHYLAGYLGVVVAALGLITIPTHLATNRELGVLRRYRASGLGAGTVMASEVALGAVMGTIAALAVLVTGAAVYGIQAPEDPLGVLAWFALGLTCFIAIGGALGSLVGSGRSAAALGNLIFVPMFLLGGGGPPRAVMTPTMQRVSDALPLSHVIGGIRHAWLGQTDDPHVLWWPLLVTVLALATSVGVARRRAE